MLAKRAAGRPRPGSMAARLTALRLSEISFELSSRDKPRMAVTVIIELGDAKAKRSGRFDAARSVARSVGPPRNTAERI